MLFAVSKMNQFIGYLGCFNNDDALAAAFTEQIPKSNFTGPEDCLSACLSNPNVTVCANNNNQKCLGGSFFSPEFQSINILPDSSCDIVCALGSILFPSTTTSSCGGTQGPLTVYSVGFGNVSINTIPNIQPVTQIHPNKEALAFVSTLKQNPLGCFKALAGDTLLTNSSPEECMGQVKSNGFKYAAITSAGRKCVGTNTKPTVAMPATDCDLKCMFGNSSLVRCGGERRDGERFNVFDLDPDVKLEDKGNVSSNIESGDGGLSPVAVTLLSVCVPFVFAVALFIIIWKLKRRTTTVEMAKIPTIVVEG